MKQISNAIFVIALVSHSTEPDCHLSFWKVWQENVVSQHTYFRMTYHQSRACPSFIWEFINLQFKNNICQLSVKPALDGMKGIYVILSSSHLNRLLDLNWINYREHLSLHRKYWLRMDSGYEWCLK